MSIGRFRAWILVCAVGLAAHAAGALGTTPQAFQAKLIADLVKGLSAGSPNRGTDVEQPWGSGGLGDTSAVRLLAIGKPAVPALFEAIRSGTGWQRVFAMEILTRMKVREAIPAMIAVLEHDKEAGVRGVAAGCLGDLKAKEALPALLKAAGEKGDDLRGQPARSATGAVGKIGGPAAIPVLESRIGATTMGVPGGGQVFDETAAEALVAIGRAGIPPLLRALEGADENARRSACIALAKTRYPEVAAALIDALGRRPESWDIVYALGEIGDRRAVAALTPLLKDGKPHIVAAAAEALGKLGAREAAPDIRAAFARTATMDVWDSTDLLQALRTLKDRESVPLLLAKLHTGRPWLGRGTCADAISEMLGPEAIPLLVGALPKAPSACAYALVRLGKPAIEAVLEAYQAGKLSGKDAAEVLSDVKDPGWLRLALGLLQSSKGDARDGVLRALRDVPLADARPDLVRLLRDPDPKVRLHAAQALGRLGDARAVPVLVDDLTSLNGERWLSTDVFRWIGKASVPALLQALRESYRAVRRWVIEALAATRSPTAIPALSAEARGTDPKIRLCAVRGLRDIGTPAALKALRALARAADLDVRWEVYLSYFPAPERTPPTA